MCTNRKVIGGIFQLHDGCYYDALGEGVVDNREDAHVYTHEEVAEALPIPTSPTCPWGHKKDGKWILVYEDE